MRTHVQPVWLTILLVLLVSIPLYGQECVEPASAKIGITQPDTLSSTPIASRTSGRPEWHSMFTNIPGDWARGYGMVFRPCRVPSLVGMTALTAALVATDDESWKFADRLYHSSDFTREASDLFVTVGDGLPQFGTAAAFALVGLIADDDRAVRTASQSVEALLSCSVVVHVIKHVTGRQRPSHATAPGGIWDVFPNQSKYFKHNPRFDAFPSGHISSTAAILTVIMENYPEVTWLRPASYVVIGLVGMAIANKGMHWFSDFPLGIALGHLFGMIASHPEGAGVSDVPAPGELQISVMPAISGEHAGVSVAVQF